MSKLSTDNPKAAQKRHKCPKCGKEYIGYPALSREDNKTEICPRCGLNEALFFYAEDLNGRTCNSWFKEE
ncbi:hypothetical protein IKW73_02730 [Candidatus Saccharibacteria bacterium]|nr:hypothetical protein [Candidatus Saccharibacteria bacterium]